MRKNQTPYQISEFEEKVIQVNRVSKKISGGNKIGFSVLIIVGDKKGRVGVGLGKAADVASAVRKGSSYAKKHLITVPMKGTTIPHAIKINKGAAQILLKPAPPGTGIRAGGAVRAVVEAAGIKDIVSKILGTDNKASNVYATFAGLQKLRIV
jgi:small subunit ribosomal protein S5